MDIYEELKRDEIKAYVAEFKRIGAAIVPYAMAHDMIPHLWALERKGWIIEAEPVDPNNLAMGIRITADPKSPAFSVLPA